MVEQGTRSTNPPEQPNPAAQDSASRLAARKTPLRVGELLVQEGFLKPKDLEKALAVQKEESALAKSTLGRILVAQGALTEVNLQKLLNHPLLKKAIGSMAVERGLLSTEQLQACLDRKKPEQLVGDALVQAGLLKPFQVQELLAEQINAPRLGELAVQLGIATRQQVDRALSLQRAPRQLGEILVELQLITPLDLAHTLNKHKKNFRLGEFLIKLGFITETQLSEALGEQRHSSSNLGQILLGKKMLTKAQLYEALSRINNIPFKTLDNFFYKEEDKKKLIRIVSQKYAEKHLVVPLTLTGNELSLGIFQPSRMQTARELSHIYGNLKISCVLITEEKFAELFEILFSRKIPGLISALTEEAEETVPESAGADFMKIELSEDGGIDKGGPVYSEKDIEAEELVNFIITQGILKRASDIHLEQDRAGVKLRYRIDGVLQESRVDWLRRKLQQKASAVVSRIKVISNLDIAERRLPQDGVFRINYFDKASGSKFDLDFRVATCRGIVGENVTIRILDSRKAKVGLEKLNHSPHVLAPFKRYLKSSAGIILVTGPTGSGKSSSLYGALQFIYNPDIKIITAEDPIEYSFPGIMQTQVNTKINLTFARLLRSFLRLDPDVILIGEMRDEETSKIGFDAAQTGHLVLSTLHTNDSVGALSRLFDLGVDRTQIASCLSCVLAQRLVRRVCSSCATEYIPAEAEWTPLFADYPSSLRFYRGSGCDACGHSGFDGRTLLSELFEPEGLRFFAYNASVDAIKETAYASGMKTMLDDGLLKLSDTTLSEILRSVPYDMIQAFRRRQEGGDAPLPATTGTGFLVTNPLRETEILDAIFSCYVQMNEIGGRETRSIDRGIFGRFIEESFVEICRQKGCRKVTYFLEEIDGRVEISVSPAG